jgi:hypothetical protein
MPVVIYFGMVIEEFLIGTSSICFHAIVCAAEFVGWDGVITLMEYGLISSSSVIIGIL